MEKHDVCLFARILARPRLSLNQIANLWCPVPGRFLKCPIKGNFLSDCRNDRSPGESVEMTSAVARRRCRESAQAIPRSKLFLLGRRVVTGHNAVWRDAYPHSQPGLEPATVAKIPLGDNAN